MPAYLNDEFYATVLRNTGVAFENRFRTEICMLPNCAGVATPIALSCVEELKVVGNGMPANRTWAPLANLRPVTVSVKLPTETVVGATEVTVGIGLSSVTRADADTEGSAALVAVTFTKFEFGRVADEV